MGSRNVYYFHLIRQPSLAPGGGGGGGGGAGAVRHSGTEL